MDKTTVAKAIRHAVIAACISAALTVVVVLVAMNGNSPRLEYYADPSFFLDVAIIALLAYGVHRRSRVAAVFLFAYFVASKIIVALDTGRGGSVVVSLLFAWFFARAVYATFVHHRQLREEDPAYRPNWKLATALGVPLALLLAFSITYTVLTHRGVLLPAKVLRGSEIRADDLVLLRQHVLEADETVEFFFPHGFADLMESGNLLTNRRVILYYMEDGELVTYALPLDSVVAVAQEKPGGLLDNAEYRIEGRDEDSWLVLSLSTESGRHEAFVDAIRRHITSTQKDVKPAETRDPDGSPRQKSEGNEGNGARGN